MHVFSENGFKRQYSDLQKVFGYTNPFVWFEVLIQSKQYTSSTWIAAPVTLSKRHVQTSHMWRSESIQQEMNLQSCLKGISLTINIDTLDSWDTETRSAMIDNSILSIYTQRSHHGITYSIISHPAVLQRSGREPGTTTRVCWRWKESEDGQRSWWEDRQQEEEAELTAA